MTLWGEWEGASDVVQVWPRDGRRPQSLHVPVVTWPPTGFRQNTDPWVFGEAFRYSNCKQLDPSTRPSRMQRLPRGSVIAFGSGLAGRFVLDTVLVVQDCVTATLAEHLEHSDDPVFLTHVLESLKTDDGHGPGWLLDRTFTLYRGATPVDPVEGMFSFVPAAVGDMTRFERPAVSVAEGPRALINAANWQAQAGAQPADWLPLAKVARAWASLAQQTLDAGLALATGIDVPQTEPTTGS